jgi:hypothetical protein
MQIIVGKNTLEVDSSDTIDSVKAKFQVDFFFLSFFWALVLIDSFVFLVHSLFFFFYMGPFVLIYSIIICFLGKTIFGRGFGLSLHIEKRRVFLLAIVIVYLNVVD